MKKIYLYLTMVLFSFQLNSLAKNFEFNLLKYKEVSTITPNGFLEYFNTSSPSNVAGISGNLFFCSGSSTTLTAEPLGVPLIPSTVSFLWSTGATTQSIIVNIAGTYTVIIENLSCVACFSLETYNATIVEFTNPIPSISGTTSFCSGSTTTLNATSGYVGYQWSSSSTNQSLLVSIPGTYTVTVTDNNSCTGSASSGVTENANPLPIISGNLSFCEGSSTILDAGTGYVSYVWSDGSTNQTLTVLAAGVYSVNVTDNSSCSGSNSVSVIQNTNPQPTIIGSLSFCTGASTILDAGAGYTSYAWSNGSSNQTLVVNSGGNYAVTVIDNNACSGSTSVSVTENTNPTPSISGNLEYCIGFSTTLDAGNGYSSYLWNNGSTIQNIIVSTPGDYIVTITDVNNCSGSTSVTVIENFAIATNLTANGPLTFCDGDSVRVSADLGYASYEWSNGENTRATKFYSSGIYVVTVTDDNGCTSTTSVEITANPNPNITDVNATEVDCNGNFTGTFEVIASGGVGPYGYSINAVDFQATGLFSGLSAGQYTVTVVDSGTFCFSTMQQIVGEPNPIIAFATSIDNLCYGQAEGSIDLTVDGGVAPYSFLWSNGNTDEDLANLVVGVYTVTISDQNNCTYENVYEILEPSQITIGTQQTNISCSYGADGTAYVDVNGGTPGYSYLWSSGQTDAFAFGLDAGMHIVTITDANGCDTTMIFEITQPSQLNTTSVENNVSCFGLNDGSVSVFPYGGTPYSVGDPYEISWNTIPVQTGATATGLAAGVYSAMIVDSAGCIKYHVVTITEPNQLIIGISTDAVSCFGKDDGEATVTTTGGAPAYSYLWSNGQTTITATGLLAGTYTVTVTDFASCTLSATAIVSEPTAINVTGAILDVKCNGVASGKVSLTVSGGTGVYNYLWNTNPARSTKNLVNVLAGTYTVVVTDNSGCSTLQSFTINQTDSLLCNGVITNADCNGGATGSILLSATGGTAPYSILWSNGNTTASNENLIAGNYTVTITDINNCVSVCNYQIINQSPISIVGAITTINCFGSSTGAISVSLSGGVAPYSYLWSNGGTTSTITNLSAGNYTVTVIDNAGCTSVATFAVTEPAVLSCICNANVINVSCYGGNNGLITAQPIGGTLPYSYLWSNGALTQTISGLTAGTYTVTITDANGCQKIGLVEVSQPNQLFASISCINNANCSGSNNGSACVTGTGGSIPYVYSWNTIPVQTTFAATGLAAGTYTAQVTDSKGCTSTATVTIGQPTSSMTCTTTKTDVVCFGQSNGQATSFPLGGTAPYTYQWNTIPAKTTKTVLGLKAGSYTVIVTDASGCSCISIVTIGQPPQLLALSSISNISCNGGNDGAIDITVTGGTPGYSFNWSNGSTNQDISGLAAGTYQVTITDSKGCIAIINVVLIQPSQLSCSTGASQVSCNGGSNGGINVIATGGTGPYAYLWSSGGINANESGLSAGTYTVTVTDIKGCSSTCSAIVSEPTALNCSVNVIKNVTCGANNGKLQATVTGGTPAYSYLWSTIPVQTTAIATGLAPGSYSVLITDMKGCTTICTGNLGSTITVSCNISSTNVSCNSGNNGTATVNPTGGTQPYTYLWNTLTSETTASVFNLTAGTYIVTVTDADGCTSNCSTIITEPTAIAVSIASINVSCNGYDDGHATENATGGTPPYTYLWSNSETTQSVTGLSNGIYTVVVTDANGCVRQDAVVITEPTLLSCSTSATNISCNGGNNGTASVSAIGGTVPLAYTWNTSPAQFTTTATGLAIGTYTVTIVDANGCSTSCTATVEQPANSVSCSIIAQPVSCFEGSNGICTVAAVGGTTPYAYSWNTNPVQTNATATGLAAGLYIVVVTDANGCTSSCFETVAQPTKLTCDISATNTSCGLENGQAIANPLGGSPTYSFLWSNGSTEQSQVALSAGTYSVIVTDNNGCSSTCEVTINGSTAIIFTTSNTAVSCNAACNGTAKVDLVLGGATPYDYLWSNGSTNITATGLCADTYTITVTDVNGCSSAQTVQISEPTAITLQISNVNVACNGGSNGQAKVNPTGGVPSYSYLWSNGETNQTINGLLAGTYTATVTDQNGCTAEESVLINQSGALTYQQSQTEVLCFNGSDGTATVTTSGGTTPYSYTWSNGQTNQTATGLSVGNYTVQISDGNGCSIVATFDITQPTLLSCSISHSNPKCSLSCDGFATAVITGGTPNYTFNWSDGQTSQTATGLCAGVYTVTSTDINNCTTVCSVTLISPSALSCSVTTNTANCNGTASGSATANEVGGTAPYSYIWSDGQTLKTATGLISGTYTVTITDQNGCETSCSGVVNQPALLEVSIINVANAYCGLNNGGAEASAIGGTPTYNYVWSNGQSGPFLINVGPGIYTVSVSDLAQCSATESVTILGSTELSGITSGTNPTCNNSNDGTATIIVTGGDGNYTYQWNSSPVQTTQTATGLSFGQYAVLVTDGNGCTVSGSTTLVEPAALSCSVEATPGGCGFANGTADITVSGGTLPYSYLWSNGSTLASLIKLSPGTYSVTVTDANNCTTSCSGIVTGGPRFINMYVDAIKVSCFGGSDGSSCVLETTGGTAPFTYLWSNGATTMCITNLSTGVYTVTVTDVNGCSISKVSTIIEPPLLVCSTTVLKNTTCNACDGSARVDVVGGTPIYSRVWNTIPVQTTTVASNLCAGTYTVTITDRKGCTTSCSVTIQSVNDLVCSTTSKKITCNGGSDGEATVTVTGSSGFPLTYLWSDGQTTLTATGLVAGFYTVTVTSSAGCISICSKEVKEPKLLTCSINLLAQPTCGICSGSINVVPNGGNSPYTFVWNTNPIRTTRKISNLCAGTYTVIVTDSKGCTSQCSINLSTSEGPVCNITGNVNICQGASTELCATDQQASYLWSNGATTQCITVSASLTYTVTINNGAGCTSSCNTTVNISTPPSCLITGNGSVCTGSSTQWCAPAGLSAYLWSTGATTQCITVSSAATYTVTTTNTNGCTSSCDKVLTIGTPPVCLITGASSFCLGSSAQLCAATNSVYLWSTGATTQCITVTAGGTYTATVTNSDGCTSSCSKTVTVDQLPTCSVTGTGSFCSGSSTQLCAATNSSYLWSTGATTQCITVATGGTYTATVSNASGCTSSCSKEVTEIQPPSCLITGNGSVCTGSSTQWCAPAGLSAYLWSTGATTQCITVSSAATYTVTTTNANGCTSSCDKVLTIGTPPVCLITGASSFCLGSSAQLCAATNSVYLWSTGATTQCITVTAGGTYTATVTNSDGCTSSCSKTVTVDQLPTCSVTGTGSFCSGSSTQLCAATNSSYLWSTGATTQCITVATGGTYTATVSNASGCTSSCSKEVTEIQPPSCLITGNGSVCTGSSTQWCAPAGLSAYLWSTGATTQCITVSSAATYTVTTTNTNGCTSSCNKVLTLNPLPACTITGNPSICQGSTTQLCGTAQQSSYLWSTGATTQCITVSSAATYTVTTTNANGCTSSCSTTVVIGNSLVINFTNVNDLTCNNGNDGSATAVVTGGSPTISYLWSNGATISTVSGLTIGTYTVTVGDNSGCTVSNEVVIDQPDLLECSVTTNNASCELPNGSANVSVTGGTANYTFLWSNGASTATTSNLQAGDYTVTVTDANGCTTQCNGIVGSNGGPLALAITKTKVLCFNQSNGTATANPTGSVSPYSYLWSNGQTTKTANGLNVGDYTVTVTSSLGCTVTGTVKMTQPTALVVEVQSKVDNVCFGGNNGSITVVVTGGNAGTIIYAWSSGQTTASIGGLTAGTYTVSVTDIKGCTATVSTTLTQPNELSPVTSQTNVSSCNNTDGTASITVSGGTPAYNYLWSNGNTNATISNLAAATYTVTVSDANSCSSTKSLTITQPAYACSTFVTGHKNTYYDPQGCLNCDTLNEYLIANFNSTFPSGLTVGCSTGFTIQLTSATAVLNFLPSSNSSAALTQNYIDPPASPLNNNLASQLVVLALNINFDLANPNWAPTSTVNFRDLIVDSVGPWDGKTVQEIFDEANNQLGGCPATFPISKSELASITSRINSSWNLGEKRSNLLLCPPNTCSRMNEGDYSLVDNDGNLNVKAYPNPTNDVFNLFFITESKENYHVRMIDMKGSLVLNQDHQSVLGNNLLTYNFNSLPKGLYMLQISIGDKAKTIKVVVQ